MRRRVQFSLKTLLRLMACVACFAGGMSVQATIDQRRLRQEIRYSPELDLPMEGSFELWQPQNYVSPESLRVLESRQSGIAHCPRALE